MRVIAITSPSLVDEDVYLIRTLLAYGVDVVHLRKPDAGIDGCRKLLGELTKEERARIVVHDFPELYDEFSLKGIHVNRHVVRLPSGYTGCKTRSCHSFEEIQRYKDEYDYLFLSPIFDSISKVGYRSKFTEEELLKASADGVIDEKVIALGGVTWEKIPYLEKLHFGGVAMVGGVYHVEALNGLKKYIEYGK